MSFHKIREILFESAGRAGLIARALVYVMVAILLVTAALSPGSADEGYSPGDTFRNLETDQIGRLILCAICIGLVLYALWRVIQAGFDTSSKGNDVMGVLARLGMLSSGVSYFLVGIAAGLTMFGRNEENGGGGTTEQFASWLLGHPFGTYLLAGFGLIVFGIGIAQIWRGVTRRWVSGINIPSGARVSCLAIDTAVAGRGILILLIGVFLMWAGFVGEADEAKGMASLLGWIRDQFFGLWLYLASAFFIGIYGYYSLIQARYLRIDFD
ncbi:DUF1206 domain-containing protein [Ponticaulis profundi]|uniref:DUF1206 domain-containing protein n=1 Tax=Ponticaulis profundi TaxID=2665222 RepID=A0ABW1SAP0_9PROT